MLIYSSSCVPSPCFPPPSIKYGKDFADFVPLFRNMGSGRRRSLSSGGRSGTRLSSGEFSSYAGGGGIGEFTSTTPTAGATTTNAAGLSSTSSSRWAIESYTSAHLPGSYSMPFGLPPPIVRSPFVRDSAEFVWPAEPPSPHGPPRPYTPASGAGEDAAALAAAAAAGDTPTPQAAVTAAAAAAMAKSEPPRGSLLFGLGGAASAAALTGARLAGHRVLVDEEHLRLEYAMAALDAAGARTRRHWRRVSRLAEAEALVGEDQGEDGDGSSEGSERFVRRAGGERLTGLHRDCRWKLAGNEHEGQEPGRFRPVLQPVVAAAQGSRSLLSASSPSSTLSASSMSMEDVGLQLARKCSRYIVDIVKTEAEGDGLADGVDGDGSGGAGSMEDSDDVWGVIGPLGPAVVPVAAGNMSPEAAAAAAAGGGAAGVGAGSAAGKGGSSSSGDSGDAVFGGGASGSASGIGVVEEVSSTGESPAARVLREEEEQRLVEERVRQTAAAVASRGARDVGADGGRRGVAGAPRVDLGPGAERWRRAVAVAAEAASGMGVTEAVVLVTPKGNRRGRLCLVDKVSRFVRTFSFLFIASFQRGSLYTGSGHVVIGLLFEEDYRDMPMTIL